MNRLRWYMDGNISRAKSQVGGTYKLDKDYTPVRVNISCRVAGTGVLPTGIDILDDGVSIFTTKPALLPYMTDKSWTTIPGKVMRRDSIITLDITRVSDLDTCRDLTVELEVT